MSIVIAVLIDRASPGAAWADAPPQGSTAAPSVTVLGGDVEQPSDVSGVLYSSVNHAGERRYRLSA